MNENDLDLQLDGSIEETALEAIVQQIASEEVKACASSMVGYLANDVESVSPPAVLADW